VGHLTTHLNVAWLTLNFLKKRQELWNF